MSNLKTFLNVLSKSGGYVEGGGQGCFQPNNCDRV